MASRARTFEPALIIHGGAGARAAPDDCPARRRAILAAAAAGAEILRNRGSALDAVITAVCVLENDPLFNAGFGSVLTSAGTVEMDAAVVTATPPLRMAPTGALRSGGVVLVSRVRNPVRLARAVMELTPHLLLGGRGAERLARPAGIPTCRPAALISPRARGRWLERRNAAPASAPASPPPHEHGTVGAAALDLHGTLAAATSTGGVAGKLPGRIGDSAILGAGLYANAYGAASATGVGEAILRTALCRDALERLNRTSSERAAQLAIANLDTLTKGEAGIIIVDRRGRFGFAHNAPAMEIATFHPSTGPHHFSAGRLRTH